MKSFFLVFTLFGLLVAIGFILFPATSWNLSNPLLSMRISDPPSQNVNDTRKSVTVIFGGDMQFDRYIRTVMASRGDTFVLEPISDLLRSADLVVANLEGPITENASVSVASQEGEAKNYVFTFSPTTAPFLKNEHIDLVNIGNNHILNFKEDGAKQTEVFLKQSGVHFFGSPIEGENRIAFENIQGTKIGFVNYNQFIFDGKAKTLADIATTKEKKPDFIVLYTHWGKEYEGAPEYVKTLAHEFIDAGADLIIGSHPHVVQAKEEYKGKNIYYSLGNSIFDQYFRPETMHGLLVQVTFDPVKQKITTEEISILLKNNGQTVPVVAH